MANDPSADKMIELQPSLVNKFIKDRLKDHTISGDFKKEFSKALSLFVFYIQTFRPKKTYTEDDLLKILEKRGMGSIAERIGSWKITRKQDADIIEAPQREEE